jgi:hypothetical protein
MDTLGPLLGLVNDSVSIHFTGITMRSARILVGTLHTVSSKGAAYNEFLGNEMPMLT